MTEEVNRRFIAESLKRYTGDISKIHTRNTFVSGASFGYSLASEEIERLKVEVERLNSMYLLAMKLNLNNTL